MKHTWQRRFGQGIAALVLIVAAYACTLGDGSETSIPVTAAISHEAAETSRKLSEPAGGYRTRFSREGAHFTRSSSPSRFFSLRTVSVGPLHLEKISPTTTESRAAFLHGSLTEWFEARSNGIEHVLSLAARPSSATEESLVVEVEPSGEDVVPSLTAHDVVFHRKTDNAIIAHYGALSARDAHGAVLAASLAISDDKKRIVIRVDDRDATYPVTIDPLIWAHEAKLVELASGANDSLGGGLAMDGDRIVAGFSGRNSNRGGAGFFERDKENRAAWSETFAYNEPDSSVRSTYRGLNVAIQGDTAVLGSYVPAYILIKDEDGGGWHPTAFLNVPWNKLGGPNTTSVTVTGDTAALSLPAWLPNNGIGNEAGTRQGALFLFNRGDDEKWSGAPTLIHYPQDPPSYSYGNVVSSGDTIAVNAGNAIHVFRHIAGEWSLEQSLPPPAQTAFYPGIAIDGDSIVAGAIGNTENFAAFFSRTGSTWKLVQSTPEPNPLTGTRYGFAVALRGDTAFVGDFERTGPGSAFRFTRGADGMWTLDEEISPSDVGGNSGFGYSIAMTKDTAVFAAVFQGSFRGALYVYQSRHSLGDACGAADECTSDLCVDGVCCDTTCGGGLETDCLACNAPSHLGTCGPADPSFECRPAKDDCDVRELCNGVDMVCPADTLQVNGTACVGGHCAAGVCGNASPVTAAASTPIEIGPAPLPASSSGCSTSPSLSSSSSLIATFGAAIAVLLFLGRRQRAKIGVCIATLIAMMSLSEESYAKHVWRQRQVFAPPDLVSQDNFGGGGVVIQGTTAFVGTASGYTNIGRVATYERSGNDWVPADTIRPADIFAGSGFGTSFAVSGDTLAVSAIRDGNNQIQDTGAVYIFIKTATGWVQQQKLTSPVNTDFFGWTIALEGDTLVVGHVLAYAAYVYTRSSGVWTLRTTLKPDADSIYFGSSVALSGNTLAVGAATYFENINTSVHGHAYIYVGAGDTWTREAKLQRDQDPKERAVFFGNHVALDGDTAVVSNGFDYSDPPTSGRAFVYTRTAGVWTESQTLVGSNASFDDGFSSTGTGSSVILHGDRMLIGASAGQGSGEAYLFERSAGGGIAGMWTETVHFVASDAKLNSFFGGTGDIANDIILFNSSTAASGRGKIYSFFNGSEGDPCTTGLPCTSGLCIDGVCCDSACGGGDVNDCMACSVAAGAAVDGTCGPTTPHKCREASGECDVAETCDGTNLTCPADLVARDGTPCSAGACSGGRCAGELAINASPPSPITPPPPAAADDSGCAVTTPSSSSSSGGSGLVRLLVVIGAVFLSRLTSKKRH